MIDKAWFDTVCRAADGRPKSRDQAIPAFPEPTLQRNTTGAAGSAGIPEVWQFTRDCHQMFRSLSGRDLSASDVMLDFGCGWGRIARLFMGTIDQRNIHGIDVNPDLVEECRRAFGPENYSVSAPFPPTGLPAGRFDIITAFSVFSHLSESACQAWMAEFARLCKPGGLICLTTRGRSFFHYCLSLRDSKNGGNYSHALSLMFPDFDEAIAKYDAGEFVHSNAHGITGGGVLSGAFYGETFIPKAYAERGFGPSVRFVGWLDPDRGDRRHPVMFFTPAG